jgi:hypothetical protein
MPSERPATSADPSVQTRSSSDKPDSRRTRVFGTHRAEFVTPPIDRGAEIRCYMRDPDGYMIEVGQSTGLLEGRLAKKRPDDLPG